MFLKKSSSLLKCVILHVGHVAFTMENYFFHTSHFITAVDLFITSGGEEELEEDEAAEEEEMEEQEIYDSMSDRVSSRRQHRAVYDADAQVSDSEKCYLHVARGNKSIGCFDLILSRTMSTQCTNSIAAQRTVMSGNGGFRTH